MTFCLSARKALLIGLMIGFAIPTLASNPMNEVRTARSQDASVKNGIKAAEVIAVGALPPEAKTTLNLIKQGGPYPFPKDGTIFGNRERRLPLHPRGYYKEYTVKTPGSRNRGARRIIAGARGEFYYTDDHYNSFKLIKE